MTYNMLRRTKSSSLLPIVRLTNYFYPDQTDVNVQELEIGASSNSSSVEMYPSNGRRDVSSGSTTPPPDYEQLYQAMQLDVLEGISEERLRKKYACQGKF